MANIKLVNNYWEASGIYDIDQARTQRQINNEITKIVEVTDTQPTSDYNEIWIPATQNQSIQIPSYEEFESAQDPAVENLSSSLTVQPGASGKLYKKGFMYRIDVGIATATEYTPTSGGLITLVTLPASARFSNSVYTPAMYRVPNDDSFHPTYAAIYGNGNVAIYVATTAKITLRMVVLGLTYFRI